MCAVSEAQIGNEHVEIYMGYFGGSIKVGALQFKVDADIASIEHYRKVTEKLSRYPSDQLAALLMDLVRNSKEE